MSPDLLETFADAAARIGVPLTGDQCRLFSEYFKDLCIWNRKMNLVSVSDDADIALKHFLDCLTPVPLLPHGELHILDIGTGPGLPGIPMKIAVESWRLHLLDSSRKRTSFLRETVRRLALTDVTVIHDRVEDVIRRGSYQAHFDVVVSRATLKLRQLIEISSYFLKAGGCLVAMKGAIPDEEWTMGEQVSKNKGLLCIDRHEVSTPFVNTPRKIVFYKKVS